jgi:iron(III) transport system substrate-binding protein
VQLGLVALVVVGCSAGSAAGKQTMTLYTCTTDTVEQAVVAGFEKRHSEAKVEVYRAPTAELNARVAADQRSGGIKADVIWACDPLTMHGYDSQGLIAAWTPPDAGDIPAQYRSAHFVGVDLLYMVVVVHKGVTPPTQWSDLTEPAYRDQVAIPSPVFAASALGLLGYLSSAPGYGIDFYRQLKANGAVQMDAPGDVLTAVEQGSKKVGVTLANAAYADQASGSPIEVAWPEPGGVAIYAPIAVTTKAHRSPLAEQFATYVAGREAQQVMADNNTYVVADGVGGPPIPAGSPTVVPDWPALLGTYRSVLAGYTAIFGG